MKNEIEIASAAWDAAIERRFYENTKDIVAWAKSIPVDKQQYLKGLDAGIEADKIDDFFWSHCKKTLK